MSGSYKSASCRDRVQTCRQDISKLHNLQRWLETLPEELPVECSTFDGIFFVSVPHGEDWTKVRVFFGASICQRSPAPIQRLEDGTVIHFYYVVDDPRLSVRINEEPPIAP